MWKKKEKSDEDKDKEDEEYKSSVDQVDDEYIVYRDLMDGIHCYLYHLWDQGLRVRQKHKTDESESVSVIVQEKLKQMRNIQGLNRNRYGTNKFSIAQSIQKGMSALFSVHYKSIYIYTFDY